MPVTQNKKVDAKLMQLLVPSGKVAFESMKKMFGFTTRYHFVRLCIQNHAPS